jgi:hypothetical protein
MHELLQQVPRASQRRSIQIILQPVGQLAPWRPT